jgi:hypothetical protein
MMYSDLLQALLNGNRGPYGKVGEIYAPNDKKQRAMRALAARTNTNPNGIDHYYHRLTTYQGAQLGGVPLGVATLVTGSAKEDWDMLNKMWGGIGKAWADSKKDLKNNAIGLILGLSSDLPAEQNPRFNAYNSKTVNFLLPKMDTE